VFRPFIPAPRRKSSVAGRLVLRAIILVVILVVGAVQYLVRQQGSALTDGLHLPVVGITNEAWEGVHGAILTDVNGDHVPDLVGRVRYVLGGDRVALAAFDGQSGDKLWESETLGNYTSTYQGVLGLADDALLFASASGDLRAYGVRDGKKRWSSSLPEKATGFCRAERPGDVRVRLADQRSSHVRLSDGQASAPAAAPAPSAHAPRGKEKENDPCVRLASDDGKTGDPGYDLRGAGSFDVAVEGMTVRAEMQRPGGPKIVLGTREKGTSVPMIAAVFDDAGHNWKSDLAGTRPLDTGPFAPDLGAVTTGRAFTEYGYTDIMKPHAVVCFDLGGHRQWETVLPSKDPIGAIQATDQRVFVSQWGRLSAYDAASGKAAFSIGKR
jgi:outer membrane protein assembly factor BamB